MNHQNQGADNDALTLHDPRACAGDNGTSSTPPSVVADGSESSGCVSWDTVVAAEDVIVTPAVDEQHGDWSTLSKTGSVSSGKQESKESTPSLEKKQSAWESSRKTGASSGKPAAVRKKNDPLMTKFKFSLQKYNKALKTTTDGQISLKYMHDKLVKLREELLQTGNYQEEELTFDSPNYREVTHCDGQASVLDLEPTNQRCSPDLKKLEVENEAMAMKLSEVLRTPTPMPQLSSDIMSKTLRAKIKCTNAKALETERKLEELKTENDDLKKQLFESKTTVDELKVLHMQATSKHQEALDKIDEMTKKVAMRQEETKKLNAVMSEKLSRLKSEYETFQKENETFRNMVEELKQDYNESLTKCKEASKTWEAVNYRYVSQKQMKDAIASDFVKLGVSYKKLQSAYEELMAENTQLREQVGSRSGRLCQKSRNNIKNKYVPRQRRVAVQTSEVTISPSSRITAVVSKTHSAQQCGDGLVHQLSNKKIYQERMGKFEREIKLLREKNGKYTEKHKLLIRQVLRLDKQCHLQLNENRRQLRLVDELRGNSKHLEEEVTVLRNKLAQTEARKSEESAKKLPSESSSSKTKRSKLSYVAVKNPSSKNIMRHSTKKTWLKSFWTKDNKPV